MTFTDTEITYLSSQDLGRLATVQPDGTLQVSPVGFRYNAELATIDIGGFTMATTQKFRNLATNDQVALVIDDIASRDPWRVRCLEIRGRGEQVPSSDGRAGGALIRVHPRRIISFGLENADVEPHLLVPSRRNVE